MEPFTVYVLRSQKDEGVYTGSTSCLQTRLSAHLAGRVRSTKGRRPLELIYQENYSTKQEALKREIFLKTGQGRKYLDQILEAWQSGRLHRS